MRGESGFLVFGGIEAAVHLGDGESDTIEFYGSGDFQHGVVAGFTVIVAALFVKSNGDSAGAVGLMVSEDRAIEQA